MVPCTTAAVVVCLWDDGDRFHAGADDFASGDGVTDDDDDDERTLESGSEMSEFDPAEIARIAAEWDDDESALHFYVRMLKGQWTKHHKSKYADCCVVLTRGGMVKKWCALCKWSHKASFALEKFEGELNCHTLASE